MWMKSKKKSKKNEIEIIVWSPYESHMSNETSKYGLLAQPLIWSVEVTGFNNVQLQVSPFIDLELFNDFLILRHFLIGSSKNGPLPTAFFPPSIFVNDAFLKGKWFLCGKNYFLIEFIKFYNFKMFPNSFGEKVQNLVGKNFSRKKHHLIQFLQQSFVRFVNS